MAERRDASRDLLFGLVALEQGHIDRDRLVDAFRAWSLDEGSSRSLSEILADSGPFARRTRLSIETTAERILATRAPSVTGSVDEHGLAATVAHVGKDPADDTSPRSGAEDPGVRYRVVRPHARGGLGEVFVALDPELNRTVALKELRPQRAFDPPSQARFLLEAELTGRLEHPGIVPVYGLGRYADGRPYYAMRFIEGETLRAAIDRYHHTDKAEVHGPGRALEFRKLLGCLIDVCNAVAYAHSRGVVHRDLKPENIMMGRFGETLVVDWGVAKPLGDAGLDEGEWRSFHGPEDSSSMTQPGSLVGTPRYMSPEQASADHERVGPASDVYGLGATLYYLLAGRAPFPEDDLKGVLSRVIRGIFPAPRRVKRGVDPALEAICLRAMALRAEDRYDSPLDIAQELEAWLADVRYRGEQEQALTQMNGTMARLCLERAFGLLGRDKLPEGMLWMARALEQAPPELDRVVRSGLSGWHVGAKLLERSLKHGAAVDALAFGPDGRRLLTASRDGNARVWDLATGTPLSGHLPHDGPVRSVAFHPDGKAFATAGDDGTLRLWDVDTGEPSRTPLDLGAPILAVRFSPDGSLLATVCRAGGSFLWRHEDAEPVVSPDDLSRPIRAFAFAPDGTLVATADDEGHVRFWETATGRSWGDPLRHDGCVSSLAFAADGRMLLTGCHDGKARLWDLDRRVPALSLDHRSAILNLEFVSDGSTIATSGEDGTARLWDAAAGLPIGEPLAHDDPIESLAFSPDGSTLATAARDGTARLWDTRTALPIGPPLSHRGTVTSLAFSLDGRRLATASVDGFARCWQVPTPLEGAPERIRCWVSVATDLEFDEGDAIRRMDSATSWELRRRLVELGGAPVR